MLEDGLTSLITSDAGISALVGSSGLFPVVLPTDAPLPAVTYQVFSAINEHAFDSTVETTKRIQFDVWGDSYASAKAVVAALHQLLDNYVGTLPDAFPGTQVLGTFRGVEMDFFDGQRRAFRVLTEYSFRYAE